MDVEFRAFPKVPRLYRDCTVTEKIDGTNGCVVVTDEGVYAQSRTRLITPQDDNFGFAAWVEWHKDELAATLGPGHHFGEWFGSKIQRGYGMTNGERKFALFNVGRFRAHNDPRGDTEKIVRLSADACDGTLLTVPVIAIGPFNTSQIATVMEWIWMHGSRVGVGFCAPEGVMVYHEAAGSYFKATFENDEKGKG